MKRMKPGFLLMLGVFTCLLLMSNKCTGTREKCSSFFSNSHNNLILRDVPVTFYDKDWTLSAAGKSALSASGIINTYSNTYTGGTISELFNYANQSKMEIRVSAATCEGEAVKTILSPTQMNTHENGQFCEIKNVGYTPGTSTIRILIKSKSWKDHEHLKSMERHVEWEFNLTLRNQFVFSQYSYDIVPKPGRLITDVLWDGTTRLNPDVPVRDIYVEDEYRQRHKSTLSMIAF